MTTTAPRFLVIYKDNGETRNRYYGPFASASIAQDFMNDLPKPALGGLKTFKMIEPYTSEEVKSAANSINNTQRKIDLIHTVNEIVRCSAA